MSDTSFTFIDAAVTAGCHLVIWENRYGGYLWAGVAPETSQMLSSAQGYTDSADMESAAFCEYLNDKGAWLPFASGATVQAALESLNAKLSARADVQLKRPSVYWERAEEAFDIIERASDGTYGIAMAIDKGLLTPSDEMLLFLNEG
jgi:hypothetical protein